MSRDLEKRGALIEGAMKYVVDVARWTLACFQHAICYDEKWPTERPGEWLMYSASRLLRTGKWREESSMFCPLEGEPRLMVWERPRWPRLPRFSPEGRSEPLDGENGISSVVGKR